MPSSNWCKEQLRFAYALALKSPDTSTQNGAIVFDRDRTIIGRGVNEFTKNIAVTKDLLERPKKYSFIEHAERNAIYNCFGSINRPSIMVCCWAACTDCARAIVQSGITMLIRHERIDTSGRWSESINWANDILTIGGVHVVSIEGILGGCEPVLFNGELLSP